MRMTVAMEAYRPDLRSRMMFPPAGIGFDVSRHISNMIYLSDICNPWQGCTSYLSWES
jgi:hypothetical protein